MRSLKKCLMTISARTAIDAYEKGTDPNTPLFDPRTPLLMPI